jgi:hypothetical protein
MNREPVPDKDNQTFDMRWRIAPAWFTLPPAAVKKKRVGMRGRIESLAEELFSLEEPWQGRFLDLVANLATDWAWGGPRPTWEKVTAWLGADLSLYQETRLLLNAWQRPSR